MANIQNKNSCGYLYVAKGEKYLLEAIDSAKSLKDHNSKHPICLITDEEISEDIFDQIIKVSLSDLDSNPKFGYLTKIQGMLASPFEKTLFVDTDTHFLDHCDELFEINKYFDLMICHDYQENSYARVNGKELEGFHTYNTGVIAFDKNPKVQSFLNKWREIFTEKMDLYWSDQPAFMEALLYSNIKIYSLQTIYNFRFNQFLPVSHKKVKILHGRHPKMAEIGSLLNASSEHRSWDPRKWTIHNWSSKKTFREILYQIKIKVKNLFQFS